MPVCRGVRPDPRSRVPDRGDRALELFLAHGFDNVTAAQFTDRAGQS